MINEGALDDVDEIYGLHNQPEWPEGSIRLIDGLIMAAICGVKILIKGQGGHGSMPHLIKDVISCGGSILTNLHQIKSRYIASKENMVLTIT